MTLTVHNDLEQGSDAWLEARRGILTASVIGQLITPTLKVANNDTSRALVATLAAERITGHVEDVYVTAAMQRGTDEEPIARDLYAKHTGQEVTEIGFIVRDFGGYSIGYSPDGLVGDSGLLEVKSRAGKKHLQTIMSDRVPPENMAQLMCGLLVTGREYADYVSYCGGMRPWIKRVEPQQDWFDALTEAAVAFEEAVSTLGIHYALRTNGLPETERLPDNNELGLVF